MISIISVNSTQKYEKESVLIYLKEIIKISTDVYVCVSKDIDSSIESEILELDVRLLKKYESCLDVNRYKDIIVNEIGYEKIRLVDSLLLTNDTVFGPIVSLENIMNDMETRTFDFWGMTEHGEMKIGSDIYPRFIQSYFMVFKNIVLKDIKFFQLWNSMQEYSTYEEQSTKFEYVFTAKMNKMGFSYGSYVDTKDLEKGDSNYFMAHILFDLYEIIVNRNYPFVPKYVFEIEKEVYLQYGAGSDIRKAIDYIDAKTEYDVGIIYRNVLAHKNIRDILNCLNLYYILGNKKEYSPHGNVGVFCYLFYDDLFDYSMSKLMNVPDYVDVYIAIDSIDKAKKLKEQYQNYFEDKNIIITVTGGRGRDIASFLVTFREKVMEYDYVCFIHDKKSSQLSYPTIGRAFNEHLWENVVGSKQYIDNVIELFEKNENIGFMCPDIEKYGSYFCTAIDSWTICYDVCSKLLAEIDINNYMDRLKNPIALGSAFWVRTKAIEKLLQYKFEYSMFDVEPLAFDGTISHAVERIFPYVAQDAGYLSAYISNVNNVETKMVTYEYILENILKNLPKVKQVDCTTAYSTIESLRRL